VKRLFIYAMLTSQALSQVYKMFYIYCIYLILNQHIGNIIQLSKVPYSTKIFNINVVYTYIQLL